MCTLPVVTTALVQRMLAAQYPQWAKLAINPVHPGGWCHHTFRLGHTMSVRLPKAACYASKVAKEHYWLPKLAPALPLPIPQPLALGSPTGAYPWHWSVYRWHPGQDATLAPAFDLQACAADLAHFLCALHRIDTTGAPQPGAENFYRGGSLRMYDGQVKQALKLLKAHVDTNLAYTLWQRALSSSWQQAPVWVHGDIAAGNLLLREGKLSAVIDFSGLVVGDPACDLVIAWTLFEAENRQTFQTAFDFDANTWARARGWALWKALIICAGLPGTDVKQQPQAWAILKKLLVKHQNGS